MKILGIDPGLATIGLGLIDAESPQRYKALEWLTIDTKSGFPLPERLAEIRRDIEEFLDEAKPDAAVVEQVFFSVNEQSAIDVAQARGVLIAAVATRGIPVLEVTPMQLKAAITGDGGADKRQMREMLLTLLHLESVPRPDDAADALAMAIYGALHQEFWVVISRP